jgi:hypothetical protein
MLQHGPNPDINGRDNTVTVEDTKSRSGGSPGRTAPNDGGRDSFQLGAVCCGQADPEAGFLPKPPKPGNGGFRDRFFSHSFRWLVGRERASSCEIQRLALFTPPGFCRAGEKRVLVNGDIAA